MEEGLGLNIQDGSKSDKYISYWLYYYAYLNTIGRADKRKQTMSVLFNDETDSPQRLEDTMNYLEPILHNVRLIASGNSDRVDWKGDKLPINDIQRYKLSNKRKMKDWLCFPAKTRGWGVKVNNPYLQLRNEIKEYRGYSQTHYALQKMIRDYFAVLEKDLQEANLRKTYLHPSITGSWRDYYGGLNQSILSHKRTISSNFLDNYQNKILATEHWERPTSGVARYHDSFSKYFTLNSFLDFFKPEVYQGGNLDEVDSEDAKNKLKQAKLILKGMRKQLREINNQIEEHEKNIEEMVREINWIKDGRRIKAQKKQLNDIIEAIHFLDEQMYEKLKNASEKYFARLTRILKKIGYNEKQIYNRNFHNYSSYSRIKQRFVGFSILSNRPDSHPEYGNIRLKEYKIHNKPLQNLLINIKSSGVDYFQRHDRRFSYWSNHLDWRKENITQTFERMNREITLNVLKKIIPCKSILVNEGRTKLPSALSLYSKSDAYVSLEGLKRYANLRIVGHKYYKVFQGGWESYMKSLREVKDYDRILITPLIEYKNQHDLGRSVFFIPAGMKIISNAWTKPIGLQYSRGYYQNDMGTFPLNEETIGNMQRQLESIYNRIINKTKNPFAKRKRMTEREERMMDWSILELRLKANEDLGFLNW